ncbi:hypothetical protein FIS3754_24030 [Fischerella sp. NIES-3754]|nr:hypothetical protein FIS3754_24030 [Fischerella sp. NIES-3754]BCX08781.1 MAG: hypothetical protein KatS3mg066_2640 [Fischerella sp.]
MLTIVLYFQLSEHRESSVSMNKNLFLGQYQIIGVLF